MLKMILSSLLLLLQLISYSQDWRYVKEKKLYRDLDEAINNKDDVYNLALYGRDAVPAKLSVIGQMKNIQYLAIENAQLTSLPASIFSLPNIRTLSLVKNSFISIPKGIGQLKTLEYLVMYDNEIEEVPDWIGGLINLETLILPRNKIRKVSPAIGHLSRLTDLSLGANNISYLPPAIGQLPSLRELYLYENLLTKLPHEITLLDKLESLHINGNKLESLPMNLGNMNKLKSLQAGSNLLSTVPVSLSLLSGLEELGLEDNPLDRTIESLHFPPHLKHIALSGKAIRNIPSSLQYANRLVDIRITKTSVTSVPIWINQLPEIDWMDLSNNRINVLPDLPGLKKLRVLLVAKNLLDTFPGNILRLPLVKSVDVSGNPLKHIPTEITSATSLTFFSIYGTRISNEEYKGFRKRLEKQLQIPHDRSVYFEDEDTPCYTDLPQVADLPVFTKLENYPFFMGGRKAWMNFVTSNIRKDSITHFFMNKSTVRDSVVLQFIVRKEGGISNLKAIAGVYEQTKGEALRLLKLSCPYWTPANMGGRNIFAWFRQVFIFEVKKENGSHELVLQVKVADPE